MNAAVHPRHLEFYIFFEGGFNVIYTEKTKEAMKLCFKAHKKQIDKSGLPYVFHPFHLAEQMKDEKTTITALLHDVAEDSKYSLKYISELGFDKEIIDALTLLTHDKSVPYMDYILKIRDNPIAKAVKMADLKHNSDLTRLNEISDKDKERCTKYLIALSLLEDAHYDKSLDYSVRSIPLDHCMLCYLTLRYKKEDTILSASFDVEKADDIHYNISGSDYYKLMDEFSSDNRSSFEEISAYVRKNGYYAFGDKLEKEYDATCFCFY